MKADLLLASKIAISLVDLYYGVNEDAKAIVWRDDFHARFEALVKRETALRNSNCIGSFQGTATEIVHLTK